MKTILVPLDTSPLAELILPHARRLASLLEARVHLLHVIELDARLAMGERAEAATLVERREYLNAQAAVLASAGVETTTEVLLGLPAEVIVERAAALGAAMIAMPTHGLGGLRRWAIGSVTDKVVQAATVPVYVVRGEAGPPAALRTILLPLDGSQLARAALPTAVELASRAQADLVLLTAMEPAANEFAMIAHESLQNALDAALQAEARALSDTPDLAGRTVTPVVSLGFAADTIIREAEGRNADLIVMATHGWGGLRRWALGSIADKVLHATTVPLVLVRAPLAPLG